MGFTRALVTVSLLSGTLVLAPGAPAAAYTPRVEAESGTIVTPSCGDSGERPAVQPGGTGSVVFLPERACAVRFATNDLRYHPATIHYTMSGFTGTACGQFVVGGAVNGDSERVCASAGTPIAAALRVEQRYRGTWTVYWSPETSWVNAHLDYTGNVLSDGRVEAEWGVLDDSGCAFGTSSRVWDGADYVVSHPASGCAARYTQEGRYALGTVTYYVTGSASACGHFEATGAITGRTATTCSAPGERVAAALTSTNVGTGAYTLTWRTALGTPETTPVRVDQHTRTRVDTVEAETGWFHNPTCSTPAPRIDGDVAVYGGIGCRQVLSVPAGRLVDSVTAHVPATEPWPVCGWFSLSGAVDGDSDEVCVDPGATAVLPVHSVADGTGSFTMTWFSLDSPDADVYVDSLTAVPAGTEAETGTPATRTCGGDTTTGPTADGTAMFLAGSGCAFRLPARGGVEVGSARIRLSGLPGTVCGHLSFSGAVTGRTQTKCADLLYGTDTFADVTATTTAAADGGTYTVTWVTETGTLPTTDVTVDSLAYVS